jgi:two-component system phosphate regulon sensor histidine kinase PhoR
VQQEFGGLANLSRVSLRSAIYTIIFVLAIIMVITLLVLWNLYIIQDYRTIKGLHIAMYGQSHVHTTVRWFVLAMGIAFLAIVIAVLSVFYANTLRGNRFKQQQRDFANMVTHELRLPLSSIQIFAQTLRQRIMDPDERDRFADGILSECSRLGLLIDQLLKFQQMEQGKLTLRRVQLDAVRFLEDFVARWPRPLKLRVEETVRVDADPLLLELVLTNFVTNAEKYGRGSVPEIVLSRSGGDANLAVRDQGRTLDRKYLKRIFRKFYRVPNLNTRRQNGIGLGLYIVKQIAEMHGGSAHAIPLEPPMGNEFFIRIPAVN